MNIRLIDFAIFTLIQYFIVTHILMFLYHGGSHYHPDTDHFIYNQNYLSDLGRFYYFSKFKNPLWFLYTLTLSLAGVGTILFFYITSNFFNKNNLWPVILGTISGISFMGIAIFTVDLYFDLHIFFGFTSFIAFLLATVSLIFSIDKEEYPNIYKALLLLNFILIFYLLLRFILPSGHDSETYLKIRVLMQRAIVYTQLFTAVYILYSVRGLIKSER